MCVACTDDDDLGLQEPTPTVVERNDATPLPLKGSVGGGRGNFSFLFLMHANHPLSHSKSYLFFKPIPNLTSILGNNNV
jgi:hypothetical protein